MFFAGFYSFGIWKEEQNKKTKLKVLKDNYNLQK
jgi:hypothetical protein